MRKNLVNKVMTVAAVGVSALAIAGCTISVPATTSQEAPQPEIKSSAPSVPPTNKGTVDWYAVQELTSVFRNNPISEQNKMCSNYAAYGAEYLWDLVKYDAPINQATFEAWLTVVCGSNSEGA